jgi:phosphoribosylpyrophosphate synthetase
MAPERDDSGRMLINHAEEVSFEEGGRLWAKGNEALAPYRNNYQVVVLEHGDVTRQILHLTANQEMYQGQYGLASVGIKTFPDGERLPTLDNESPQAQSVYLVGSILNASNLLEIGAVADHYKRVLNAKSVTLISPYLFDGRQDKNVDKNGGYVPEAIALHTVMKFLARSVDRMMVFEPHSAATQSEASNAGLPLFPVTPFEHLMTIAMSKPVNIDGRLVYINPNNTIIVRPDVGRNISATRSSEVLEIPSVCFEKTRINGSTVILRLRNPNDQARIEKKIAFLYDDEISTFGTGRAVTDKTMEYGALGIVIVAVHGKCTDNWKSNIDTPIIKKIYLANTRPTVCDIKPYLKTGKIEMVSLEPVIRKIIQADLEGVNFWQDAQYKSMVLQETPEERNTPC